MKLSHYYEDEITFYVIAYETSNQKLELVEKTFINKQVAIEWAMANKDYFPNKRLHIFPALLLSY